MRHYFRPMLMALCVSFASLACAQDVGIVASLKLRNTQDGYTALDDYKDARGFILVFTCNHCPFAKLYSQRLNDLHRRYAALNVPLLAINPVDTLVYDDERFEFMIEKSKRDNFLFPYLQDDLQLYARYFKAEHTPQAFVVWKTNDGTLEIKYKGAIDDNGAEPEKAHSYVDAVVSDLLEGKQPRLSKTDSFGCRIYLREAK